MRRLAAGIVEVQPLAHDETVTMGRKLYVHLEVAFGSDSLCVPPQLL